MAAAKKYLSEVSTLSWDSLKPIGPPSSIWDDERGSLVTIHDTVSNKRVYPRLPLHWGQHSPMGDLFKNKVAGCANTAAAMILAYLKYPAGMSMTYPGAQVTYQTFEWDKIFRYLYNGRLEINNMDSGPVISRLCREIGFRSNSDDTTAETKTNTNNLRLTLSNLGLELGNDMAYGHLNIQNYMNDQNMIMMYGSYLKNDTVNSHIWIVDGYHYYTIHSADYIVYFNPHKGKTLLKDLGTKEYLYNHINWGWNGNGNGYFSAYHFNPSNPYLLDSSKASINPEFNINLRMFSVSRP